MSHRAQEISQDSRDARPEKRPIPTDSFPGLSSSLPVSCRIMGTTLCVTKAALLSLRPLVLWDNSVVLYHYSKAVNVGCSIIWFTVYFFIFSHFHNGFCGHIAADVNHLPPVWLVLNGPQGLLWALQLPTGPNTFHTG